MLCYCCYYCCSSALNIAVKAVVMLVPTYTYLPRCALLPSAFLVTYLFLASLVLVTLSAALQQHCRQLVTLFFIHFTIFIHKQKQCGHERVVRPYAGQCMVCTNRKKRQMSMDTKQNRFARMHKVLSTFQQVSAIRFSRFYLFKYILSCSPRANAFGSYSFFLDSN